MKKTLTKLLVGAALAVVSLAGAPAFGQAIKDGYVTYASPTGVGQTTTNLAQIVFPSSQDKTIRLVNMDIVCNTNTGTFSILGGTTQTRLTYINGLATNLVVASTSGFQSNDVVIVQNPTNDFIWQGVVWGTNNLTNLWFTLPATNAFPVNSYVYRMSDGFTSLVESNKVRASGLALYGAQRRKPVLIRVVGTNSTVAATAIYESY
jgi:hypothetical protein